MIIDRLLRTATVAGLLTGLAACSGPTPDAATTNAVAGPDGVSLRNLAETNISAPARASYPIEGRLIATPSDPSSRYFLLRERERPITDTIVAIIRQEHAGRIAYARVEVDCARRLFHVLGVGNRRSFAETNVVYDGPLRPVEGLPLRVELATDICRANNTPLAAA